MKIRSMALSKTFLPLCLLLAAGALPAQEKLVLDDFEAGTSNWTTNDGLKTGNTPATLIEVLPSTGSALAGTSKAAGLFTFKAAKNSWASASLRVDGAAWAKVGGRSLSFYLNAGGNSKGFEVLVRRHGKPNDEVFRLPWPVRLDVKNWRKVVIPLTDFKSERDKTPLTKRLNGVYLLQVVMRGQWDARFFSLDQLQVEGTGKPIPVSTPAPAVTPAPPASPGTTKINVDFLRASGKIRTGANVTVGAMANDTGSSSYPLNSSSDFRSALRELKARYIRLDAGEYVQMLDSSRLSFDFSPLQNAVIAARSFGAQPLVAITYPAEWNLDSRGYAAYAGKLASAVNSKNVGPVRSFDIACGAGSLSDAAIVSYYNAARAAVRRAVPNARVGGAAISSADSAALKALLKSAAGLDFLTIQDFGTSAEDTSEDALLNAARNVTKLKAAANALDASRWKNAAIYAIANVNGTKVEGREIPVDGRTVQMVSAAWWGIYLANASRLADQVFHNDGALPEWGLLDDGVRAYPAYYALWMWNTYAPSGSSRVKTDVSDGDIFAAGFNTATAHSLLLINTQAEERTAQVSIRGFPVLRSARMRIYDDARSQPNLVNLPKSPYQTIKLKPFACAVVQFIEPPKR